MALVDPRVLKQLKDKGTFKHEKMLERKYSRPSAKKETSACVLEVESILSDNTMNNE